MRAAVLDHFKQVDPLVHTLLVKHDIALPKPISNSSEFFRKICDDIISQQLAGKAAEAIFNRFCDLFPDREITVEALLAVPDQAIRDIGASWAKVRYLKDLAVKTQAGLITYSDLPSMPDEEVIAELTQVKGIGRWTAEMFLLFTLGRADVFSFGDLGLKNGFKKLYDIDSDAVALTAMKEITARWSPYRSYGSLALWKHLDNR